MRGTPSRSRRLGAMRWLIHCLGLTAGLCGLAHAGGPIGVTSDGQPLRLDNSRPIPYRIDQGSFGTRSHATAAAIIRQALQVWQDVPTAALQFQSEGELPQDITGRNVAAFLDGLRGAEPNMILFDHDGSIVETLLGQGASAGVLGFTTPLPDRQLTRLLLGYVVLNGRMASGFSADFVTRNAIHELGHLLGMDHSQINFESKHDGDPTNDHLTPVLSYFRGPNGGGGLHADDAAWISYLYPSAGFAAGTGSIRGRVLLPDRRTGLAGVNVIARRVDDPLGSAVSCVSGYSSLGAYGGSPDPARLGEFLIPGLTPGAYTLEVQQLEELPAVRLEHAFVVGGRKFWREGASSQDAPGSSSEIVVGAGQEVRGIDLLLNGEDLGEPSAVKEQEPNALPNGQSVAFLPAVISGEVEDGDGTAGPPIQDDDDLQAQLHDVYRVTLREPTTVTAILTTPSRGVDLDLYVAVRDGDRFTAISGSTLRGTPPEFLQFRLAAGRYYFGVHRAGDRGSRYTLQLMATPSPEPEVEPAFAYVSHVVVGDVTRAGATARWHTTAPVPSDLYYNSPLREAGATSRVQEHAVPLTELSAEATSEITVYAQAEGGVDASSAPVRSARAPAADGSPRVVIGSSVYPLFFDLIVEVHVRLTNAGDGDASKVRIEEILVPNGWLPLGEAFAGIPLPGSIEVGDIGASGVGSFVVRLVRMGGTAQPKVTVRGTYSDAAGTALKF